MNTDFTYKLTGIGEGTIATLGYIENTFYFKKFKLKHNLQVVEDNFPIPCDGIIGLDFIKKFNCVLDYNAFKSLFVIRPVFSNSYEIIKIFDAPKLNAISLPARSEVIRKISVNFNEEEFLVPNQEIAPGIFVSNTIACKRCTYVKILNTTNQNILLEDYKISGESLEPYTILQIDPIKKCDERDKTILQKLESNCPLIFRQKLLNLCRNYTDVFAIETDKVTCNNFYKQKLKLKDDTPVYIKNYRLPQVYKPEIEKQINKMIEDDIIEPSASEYNSPILLVPKKSLPGSAEKKWRLVIDFRQLNKKLTSDKYPLPRIDDILDQLGRAKYFSCLDLISGFHQIELDTSSRDLTSFSSINGSFRFKRLPFGLKIAPNSFQRMMQIAFSGLGPSKAFVYMDDLIAIGCSEEHMISNLKSIFEICRKTNLKLHPDKCTFFSSEVTFLGHKCTDKGILPDESKFEKILNYPKPSNADEAKRFVAFVNYYRRFIPNFALYSIHLTRLTRKNSQFKWSEDCEKAFNYLKNSLLDPKILKYPDFNKQFCITTDASKIACGAVLSQEYDGLQFPVAFASKTFTKGESNKSVIEQELTAIHWAVQFFKPYIYGTKFLIKSDHKPLTYLFALKNPSSKLTRMRLDLEEFDFDIEYIKGKDNCGADALSRIDFGLIKRLNVDNAQIYAVQTRSKSQQNVNINPAPVKTNEINQQIYETMTHKEMKKIPCLKLNESMQKLLIMKGKTKLLEVYVKDLIVQGKILLEKFFPRLEKLVNKLGLSNLRIALNDNIFKYTSVHNFKEVGNELLMKMKIALTPELKIITDPNEKTEILTKFHNDPNLGGHSGINRLLTKIRKYYTWKNITYDVRKFVNNCEQCKLNKSGKKSKEPMVITQTPQKPFDRIQIDTIGPLPRSILGNEYAVTIMCELTKYLIAIPVTNKSAETVAKAIVDNCILIYGSIKEILTDLGTEYKNKIFAEVCKLLNINQINSTPYHHQTLGMVERSHRTFNEYIRSYISPDKSDWDEWLTYFVYCYNTTPSSVHGYAPFELVFGKTPQPYSFMNERTSPIYNFEAYDKELKFRLQEAHKRALKLVDHAKLKSKELYDRNCSGQSIQLNDKVYLYHDASHKLDSVFKGPYQVIEADNRGNCKITNGSKTLTVHKNRLKLG